MKIAYIYPEKLPAKNARSISVVNTVHYLSNHINTTLIYEKSKENFKNFYNVNFSNLNIIPLKRNFVFLRSNKIFNFNLSKYLNDFDIFYVRHLKTAEFLLRKKKNVIYEVHEIFSINNPKVKNIEKYVLENANLICINKTLCNEIEKYFNIKKYKIIHNGTNFAKNYIKKDFSKIEEAYYIGNFYEWKGVDFLIEAFNEINLNLKIIGDGKRKDILKNMANKNINFLGFKPQKEIELILQKAKLTFIPNVESKYTNFTAPLKLYEYLATSNIVLASDLPTIQEIITDGVNGFLFKRGDKKDFIKKLNYILNLSPKKLEEISKNAYETSKKFTWDNRAKQIIEFIKEINEKNNLPSSKTK